MGVVLGIESSCDETAAALVAHDRTIVAQAIASQDESHAPYGGVVPEIAARAHAERLAPMIEGVMREAGISHCQRPDGAHLEQASDARHHAARFAATM